LAGDAPRGTRLKEVEHAMRTVKRALFAILFGIGALVVAAMPSHALDFGQLLGHGSNDPTLETFKIIHVTDLRALMTMPNADVHIYDANTAGTRQKYGVIPGATLLDSDDKYDLSVLPSDKHAKLVFYCANWL
jgi:hypothetical protein